MLIVTGSIRARPEDLHRVLELSLEHVRRSRQEDGCLLHSVHRDVEDEDRLVFVEHWADADALRVRTSRYRRRAPSCARPRALAAEPPELSIYEAHTITI